MRMILFVSLGMLLTGIVGAQVQERLDGYVAPLKKRDGSACFDTRPQICRTPWVRHERTNLTAEMSVFDQIAWVCESRSQEYWCSTIQGEGCTCSGNPPPGEWKREGEDSGIHDEIREQVIEPCSEAVSPSLGIGARTVRYSYQIELGKVENAVLSAVQGKPDGIRHGIYEAGVKLCALFIEQAAPVASFR